MILKAREILRAWVISLRNLYLRLFWGHDIHPTTIVSFSAFMDRTCPQNISIGEYSIITRGVVIMSHDFSRGGGGLEDIYREKLPDWRKRNYFAGYRNR